MGSMATYEPRKSVRSSATRRTIVDSRSREMPCEFLVSNAMVSPTASAERAWASKSSARASAMRPASRCEPRSSLDFAFNAEYTVSVATTIPTTGSVRINSLVRIVRGRHRPMDLPRSRVQSRIDRGVVMGELPNTGGKPPAEYGWLPRSARARRPLASSA
ncbi:MAG: hypothetical protein AUI10_03995 [Actinobacteria bacterium 13_2_20CM_2_72_6]|nr:MAG: hypothetical protein AUI10_03995 [Actinobacteria bacterium 13_2_20CM_2_72_6]